LSLHLKYTWPPRLCSSVKTLNPSDSTAGFLCSLTSTYSSHLRVRLLLLLMVAWNHPQNSRFPVRPGYLVFLHTSKSAYSSPPSTSAADRFLPLSFRCMNRCENKHISKIQASSWLIRGARIPSHNVIARESELGWPLLSDWVQRTAIEARPRWHTDVP
jgi:hypothetical protein